GRGGCWPKPSEPGSERFASTAPWWMPRCWPEPERSWPAPTAWLRREPRLRSGYPAKCQVQSLSLQPRVREVLQRHHAGVAHAISAAPDRDVAVIQRHPGCRVGAFETAEQKHCRHAQRHRDDGCLRVAFILILVQSHAGSGAVAID